MISPGEPTSLSGQDLLAEFSRGGHEGPFEEIVRRYAGMVFNVCLKVTHDKHEAEDATQAVFLTLAVQVKRGTEIKALGPWLQQVARRLSLDMRRSQKRRKRREETHYDLHTIRREQLNDAAVMAPDIDELKTILHEELQKLPAKYRLPLILHYFGGLSRDEMAGELNCKASTLGVRIFRGRQMLAGKLSSRGVTLPDETLGLMLGVTVKSTFTGAALRSSSHAVAAVASRHEAAGLLANQIIAISRRATSALVLGKVKLVITVAALACMSLGAIAKAAGMLPNLSVERLLLEPIRRLMEPLTSPINFPIQATAKLAPTAVATAQIKPSTVALLMPPIAPAVVKPAAVVTSTDTVTATPAAASQSFELVPGGGTMIAAHVAVSNDAAVLTASVVKATDASGESSTLAKAADAIEASAGDTLMGAGGGGGFGTGTIANSPVLYLPPSHSSGSMESGTTSQYATTLVVPTQNGKVLERDGVIRGWGKIARTGAFDVNGKVIADGGGIDRSLDLTGFTNIHCSTPNSADGGQNGWYAVNHGRLDMKLQGGRSTSRDPDSLTWGDDPAASQLTLVNSVRVELTSSTEDRPSALSLLAVDRGDLPSLADLGGVPIGLWKVESATGPVGSAGVTIRYDDAAVRTLGENEYSVRLWFYDDDSWQLAPPQSFHLDVTDHLASGTGEDFSYFALTVPDMTPTFASATFQSLPVSFATLTLPAVGLPEPSSVLVCAAMMIGLGRRVRRKS